MPEEPQTKTWKTRILPWLGFVLLVAVGAGFRLYEIEQESPWFDEIFSFAFEQEEGLGVFLYEWFIMNPAGSPLYFVIEYFWLQTVGDSILGLRVLSLIFSLASALMFFILARKLVGEVGAFFALACLSLSPFHIYFAQEIRMYACLLFFAAGSGWTFLNYLEHRSNHWLVLNMLFNILLIWTHTMGSLLIAAQGLTWLLRHPTQVRYWFAWGVGHLLHGISVFGWLSAQDLEHIDYYVGWIDDPTFQSTVQMSTWYATLIPDTDSRNAWLPMAALIGFILILIFLIITLRKREIRSQTGTLLAFTLPQLIVIPAAVHISHAMDLQIGVQRYFFYGSLAVYLLLAGVIQRLPFRYFRYAVVLVCIAALSVQAASLERPFRTNWDQLIKLVETHEHENDVFMVDSHRTSLVFNHYISNGERIIQFFHDPGLRKAYMQQYLRSGLRVWVVQVERSAFAMELPEQGNYVFKNMVLDGARPRIQITLADALPESKEMRQRRQRITPPGILKPMKSNVE